MRTVLSELDLDGLEDQNVRIEKLSYGNRLISFLSKDQKRKCLEKFENDSAIQVIVCCRESARIILDLNFPGLKLIQLTSTGFDNVPVEALCNKGIAVANLKSVYNTPISETVVYSLLRMSRRIQKNPNHCYPRILRGYSGIMTELAEKKALIMGTGEIGTAIAKKLAAMEMNIDGYNRSGKPKEPYGTIYNDRNVLLNALHGYHFVISTMPATKDTETFCDQEFFSAMDQEAVFMNVGRTQTVDEHALYAALKNNTIGGAVLDLVELLPFAPFNRFRRLKNVLVLPGIAASSVECNGRVKEKISKNLAMYLETGICPDVIAE